MNYYILFSKTKREEAASYIFPGRLVINWMGSGKVTVTTNKNHLEEAQIMLAGRKGELLKQGSLLEGEITSEEMTELDIKLITEESLESILLHLRNKTRGEGNALLAST